MSLTAHEGGHRFAVMKADTSLGRSILWHGTVFFLAQCALLVCVTFALGMQWLRCALFIGVSAAYHGILTTLLFVRREDFHLEGTTDVLPRVNLPNTLTIGRLSSIPTLLFLVLQASSFPGSLRVVIVPLMSLVFVTDFLDGIVARRRKEITFVGRYLDSTSDYLMIIALSIAFYAYRIIPLWFFILIVARLGLFAIGMAVLALRDGKTNPLATFLGKASVFAVMVLYVMEIAGMLGIPWIGNETVVTVVEYVVAAVIAVSFVDKAVFLTRMFRTPREKLARPAQTSHARRLP
jgi:phosphatidylglycerophosphate synthase